MFEKNWKRLIFMPYDFKNLVELSEKLKILEKFVDFGINIKKFLKKLLRKSTIDD